MTFRGRSIGEIAQTNKKQLLIIACALVVAVAYGLLVPTNYLICVGISILTFAALGTAWNIIGGYAGQNCWCMASFMSMGSYASVLFYSYFKISPWISMWVGVAVAVMLAFILGNIAFKHRGIYFTLMTTSLSEITTTRSGCPFLFHWSLSSLMPPTSLAEFWKHSSTADTANKLAI